MAHFGSPKSGADKIGRLTTAGIMTEYPLPTSGSLPEGIVQGPDGALWFTEYYGNKIGRINTTGVITEYSIPLSGGLSYPTMIASGPDGAMWFTEYSNYIGRITTAGAITQYPAPASGNYGITTGPDGELWFAEANLNKIGEAVFVTAGLSVSPSTGVYGTKLTFMGSTFAPRERRRDESVVRRLDGQLPQGR
jgi:streptogramin lyase